MQSVVGGGALVVAPDDEEAVGGYHSLSLGVALGNLVLRGLLYVVRQVHAFDVDFLVSSVIEFHPVALLAILVDVAVVRAADLVDADGGKTLCLGFAVAEAVEGGRQLDGACGQADFGVGALHGSRCVDPSLERTTSGCLCTECDGSKEVAVELSRRHFLSVNQYLGSLSVAVQRHGLSRHVAKSEGGVVLQGTAGGCEAAVERVEHVVGR